MAEERNAQRRSHNGHGAEHGVEDVAGAMAEQASTAEQMGRTVQQVGRANAALLAASQRSGAAAQRAGEVVGNFRTAIEASARSQPAATVALAALAGFVLGAVWRRGR